ncbi:bifunctional 3-(3-hydroxy-phenyl)propionate/3-hydroxycinnamic acid hydroxylase [uncultured Hoeflea sp.]|uniref:bifunctional 3-(3-hydroxy-phenyl)propionate/3-hydroxycinnamic acid hydroxylase MhpA n=1 Tax=uncultured Hoeflea sp. TaxID=538666 RepID=UPI0030D9E7FB
MDSYPAEIPVVIVGGGPAGLTAANLLAVYGVECIVLERESEPLNLPRAIVLDDEGLRTFQVFGIDKTYIDKAAISDGSRYYDDAGTCFAQTGAGLTTYGFCKRYFINQPELETELRDRLEQQLPGALRFSSEVLDIVQEGDHAVVMIRDGSGATHVIRTSWVLACDGGRSPIRERLGIAMSGSTYKQDWIVLDMLNDPDSSNFSKFMCSSTRPAVSVPAPRGGRRYEFMVLSGETREQVLDDAFLADLLKPYRTLDAGDVVRKTVYTFHARMAESFRHGRILLLGDAAHLTPPFAGQGMNAGFRDAHNVAWKIASVLNGGASPAILDSYEEERRKPAWDMIQLAVTMGNFIMPSNAEQVMFRDLLIKALEPFPNVRDYLIQMRFKPKPRYGAGLFLDIDTPIFEASLVGEMVPQPAIIANETETLLDEILGVGFALIGQSDGAKHAMSKFGRTSLLGLPLVTLDLNTMGRTTQTAVRSTGTDTERPLLTHRDQILLIRPDRYCAAAIFPDDLEEALSRYETLFSRAEINTRVA